VVVDSTPCQEKILMDLVKTSLIIGIGVTLYYLLLQWPVEEVVDIKVSDETFSDTPINDSKPSLTETLAPMDVEAADDPFIGNVGKTFLIDNKDLLLVVDAKSGRIIDSKMKTIKETMGSDRPLELFGKVGGNMYFGNSGFYTRSQGYLEPNFSKVIERGGSNNSKIFVLSGESNGLTHEKTITFQDKGYSVVVEDKLTSKLLSEVSVTPYVVIERNGAPSREEGMAMTYLGPVFSTTQDVYEKYDFDDLYDEAYRNKSKGGWVALIQHYFLSAWVPEQSGTYLYQGQWGEGSKRYSLGYTSPDVLLGPGDNTKTANTLYVGPKLPGQLSKIQENLDLTVDYGFLWWLGKPMYWVLEQGNKIFNNWGLAIIFLTVVIKLVTWPLSAKAYQSMGKMRELQPQMQALQERYGSDKQKMSQELMEFYKKEGVNPLGGCLPMLAQMPFFLAFYWVLLETVELRHSPFFFWIQDLSAMDPYYVLPLLNGAGMYLSQKMTPTPPNADPMQAQMMKFFPLIFAVIFAWFPSGLVLYWLMNMTIQIFQQWWYSRGASSKS